VESTVGFHHTSARDCKKFAKPFDPKPSRTEAADFETGSEKRERANPSDSLAASHNPILGSRS
jgi:hypothetical protein